MEGSSPPQVRLVRHTLLFLIIVMSFTYAVLCVPPYILQGCPRLVKRTRLTKELVAVTAQLAGIRAEMDRIEQVQYWQYKLDLLHSEKEELADELWCMGVDVGSLERAQKEGIESRILWFPDESLSEY
ncbi:hypothetical protein E3J38_06725 [candidate division TA06 bacterium]|uniref:Uncharacterized protein n=1 Tax=candidate division TA06 bacterium TaxID=2250710 RepID=A0A523XKG3_UNCT6|nr:MAG: hypothetical protein E3J38_06725 [candidate division TA06 bacterium]